MAPAFCCLQGRRIPSKCAALSLLKADVSSASYWACVSAPPCGRQAWSRACHSCLLSSVHFFFEEGNISWPVFRRGNTRKCLFKRLCETELLVHKDNFSAGKRTPASRVRLTQDPALTSHPETVSWHHLTGVDIEGRFPGVNHPIYWK